MGKAAKWFRGLLGLKSTDHHHRPSQKPPPPKKKWSFAKSSDRQKPPHDVVRVPDDDAEASKHAIAVAAATAAVAEAAVAAAQAAAAVVQLTSSGRNISATATACVSQGGARYGEREEWAAVTIQSHFRAYLSRRALRALKALVKLQALVRGHLVRRQTAYAMRRLQALVRAQVRARAGRALMSESPHSSTKSSHFNYAGPATPEKFEHSIRSRSMKHEQIIMLKRNGSRSSGTPHHDQGKSHYNHMLMDTGMSGRLWEQAHDRSDNADKILEVDTGSNPHASSKRRSLFYSCHLSLGSDQNCPSYTTSKESTARQSIRSLSSGEVQSLSPLNFAEEVDESAFCTADNSPAFYSASSRGGSSKRGAFTPTKSDGTRSCLSGYSDHPNYMSYTESSKAKVRSLSAPKQRPQYERSSSTKRYSVHGYGESRPTTQKVSTLHANFTSKAYPGSGRLDRSGMPVRSDFDGYSSGNWQRY